MCVPRYEHFAVGCELALTPTLQANWGPNATTFVIPAELFPTKWKSTGHGISAAAGKAGAIIGAFGFLFASQPAQNEITWKFPCQNSRLFEYATFAKSSGASPTLGAVTQLTAHFQNLAVPGFPYLPTSVGLVKPPWKNSLVLPADLTAAAYITALNAAQGTSYDAAHYAFGTATSGKAPYSNGTLIVNGVSYGDYFFNTSVSYATPEGVVNPHQYGFPQVGIDGTTLGTVSKLPAGSSGCLVKPNCPGGMIGTPAINNGVQSYQCVCPIPTPLSGCFSYGIGIQGSLGVLAVRALVMNIALLPAHMCHPFAGHQLPRHALHRLGAGNQRQDAGAAERRAGGGRRGGCCGCAGG